MSFQSRSNILVFDTPEQVALSAAERFVELAGQASSDHSPFAVVLAGGTTPRRMYELLASEPFSSQIDWLMIHIFFGDERTVPSNDPDSNFRMASEALLTKVPIPPQNVHRINGEGDPVENARDYEAELKTYFSGSDWPRFDLVLLGMGKDGHTASLFPGTAALDATQEWVIANWVDKLEAYRITLTAPAINASAAVECMVTGNDKADALAAVLNGPLNVKLLPAQLIRPLSGELIWHLDAAAASRLKS